MTAETPHPSRRDELLERAYGYVCAHGMTGMSLRPLAAEIGSSPRVLLFLFGSKEGLVRAVLARARAEEAELLESIAEGDLAGRALATWRWLSAPAHRGLLNLWVESYGQSLVDPDGPWSGFAAQTVGDWLSLLAIGQPARGRRTRAAEIDRTFVLALLRGALLDLLATGDVERTTRAVERGLDVVAHR